MEMSKLVGIVKENKEMFNLMIDQFEPIIKKYTKLLCKDEAEDVRAELIAALWEAVCSITFYNDEGQVVSYLTRAIKNKYLELYRKSRKRNDKIIAVEEEELSNRAEFDRAYENLITVDDMNRFGGKLKGKKKEIFELIFCREYSDIEAAKELKISRQYVHRIKLSLIENIRQEILDIQ